MYVQKAGKRTFFLAATSIATPAKKNSTFVLPVTYQNAPEP